MKQAVFLRQLYLKYLKPDHHDQDKDVQSLLYIRKSISTRPLKTNCKNENDIRLKNWVATYSLTSFYRTAFHSGSKSGNYTDHNEG